MSNSTNQTNAVGWAGFALFMTCGPICHFLLYLWAGCDPELYCKAVLFQPQVFLWIPLFVWMIVVLAGPAAWRVYCAIGDRRGKWFFVGINVGTVAFLFAFDLCSPNVMPWEVSRDSLGRHLNTFREYDPTNATWDPDDGRFGSEMAQFVWQPTSWSVFRLAYFVMLIVSWTVVIGQITTSWYAARLCRRDSRLHTDCVKLLAAAIPVLPVILFRRINHLNKRELYLVDAKFMFDVLLAILLCLSVGYLLHFTPSRTRKIEVRVFVVIVALGAIPFLFPQLGAAVLYFHGVHHYFATGIGIAVACCIVLMPLLGRSSFDVATIEGLGRSIDDEQKVVEDATKSFDVFLSHNSLDKPAIRRLADALIERDLKPWLDERELQPGEVWQAKLEQIIKTTKTAIVTLGPNGLGPWEVPEMRACLNQFVKRKLPVIPVLLPGATESPELPLFLQEFTWVDLRSGLNRDGVAKLVWGITGRRPDEKRTLGEMGIQSTFDCGDENENFQISSAAEWAGTPDSA